MKGPTPFDDTCSGIDAQLSLGDGAAGAFTRSVPLPAGADVDDVKATYEKGIKVSDEEMDQLNLKTETFHGEWNYSLSPTRR